MKKLNLIILISTLTLQLNAAVQPNIIHSDKANYSIKWDEKFAEIKNVIPEIKIDGKWISANDCSSISWMEKDGLRLSEPNNYDGSIDLLYLVCRGHPVIENFTIIFELMEGRPYLVMKAQLQSKVDFTLGGIKLINSTKENIILTGKSKDWIIFNESVAAPHTGALLYPYMLDTQLAEVGKFSEAQTGVWLSMLVNDKEKYSFSFASLSAELWPNNFKWELPVEGDFNKLRLSARSGAVLEKEEILVPAGKQITTDAFLVGFWADQRPTITLQENGVIMGENVRKGKPMRCPQPGWSSWHSYSRYVSESNIIDAADFMADELSNIGWKTIQIDGGWWTQPGLYYVNDLFPKGIRYLSNYVSDRNLDFGIHISPLRVNPKDPVLKANPDWILKSYSTKAFDANDDEMVTTKGMSYVDGSHPDVVPFLTGRYQQLVEGYRPVFMKWDHHYGALEEGQREDPTMTSLQAHNKAIRSIRGSLPEELIVTRSMGYLLGALECYDAIRVGNDINHPGVLSENEPYANITYGKTLGSIEDKQVEKGLIRFARSVARNYYVHKNIAICDPDAFFVSPQYSLDEAKCHITLDAIMGGLFFTGDRIESLPQKRLELLKNKEIFAVNQLGVHAIPLDLFSGVDIPAVWKIETKDRVIITIFNWMDEEVTKTYSLKTDFELENKDYAFKELWTNEMMQSHSKKLLLNQRAHSVKIMEITK
jgi:Melibiase